MTIALALTFDCQPRSIFRENKIDKSALAGSVAPRLLPPHDFPAMSASSGSEWFARRFNLVLDAKLEQIPGGVE